MKPIPQPDQPISPFLPENFPAARVAFLRCYSLVELARICARLDLDPTGTHDELVQRLLPKQGRHVTFDAVPRFKGEVNPQTIQT